jgi:tetratricopeptide (TPR) repeat protein
MYFVQYTRASLSLILARLLVVSFLPLPTKRIDFTRNGAHRAIPVCPRRRFCFCFLISPLFVSVKEDAGRQRCQRSTRLKVQDQLRSLDWTTMISWLILTALLAARSSSFGNNNSRNDENKPATRRCKLTTYEVCLSPGCIADGASQTLEKLQALAPPNVIVKAGSCSSLCGNGPVLVIQSTGGTEEEDFPNRNKKVVTKKHRKVSGAKILDLLEGNDEDDSGSTGPPEALIEGYELVLQADALFTKSKDYAQAVQLYEKALAIAFRPAMDLQTARDQMQKGEDLNSSTAASTIKTKQPTGLQWLIRARCNEATCKLQLDDVGGALFAAQGACNLSRNTSADSLIVLSQVYQQKRDAAAELQALQTMFALPVDEESKLSFTQQNQRRELGFRLAKLEREAASSSQTKRR